MVLAATNMSVLRHLPFDGPFNDTRTAVLVDSLEAQYERGDPLDPEIVWEIVERLAVATRPTRGS